MNTATYSAERLSVLRKRVVAVAEAPRDTTPQEWSKSLVDPAGVVAVFPSLSIRPGFELRAYRYRAGGNGNGSVYALRGRLLKC
jgi:hypothetical protein